MRKLGLGPKSSYLLIFILSAIVIFSSSAHANIKQIKAYKEAYPDEKPKCACCHTSDKPKKDDGQHDLNDYGKKVVAINKEPDQAAYTQAGKAPEATK